MKYYTARTTNDIFFREHQKKSDYMLVLIQPRTNCGLYRSIMAVIYIFLPIMPGHTSWYPTWYMRFKYPIRDFAKVRASEIIRANSFKSHKLGCLPTILPHQQ